MARREVTVEVGHWLYAYQLRAARAMLDWKLAELVHRSGVSEKTIRRCEIGYGPIPASPDTEAKLRWALEHAGVVFIDCDKVNGPGLRMCGRSPGRRVPVPDLPLAITTIED